MASRSPPQVGTERFRNRDRKSQATQENTTMFIQSKIALSLALVLATASTAMAAPKHAVRHHAATARHLPAGTYLSYGSVRTGRAAQPTYMTIQDIGIKDGDGYYNPTPGY
jgi:hypothetical protein